MKSLLIDVERGAVEIIEVPDNLTTEKKLKFLYFQLDCSTIDIVNRVIGKDKWFTIVCDDEGLFKANAKVSAWDRDMSPMLVGNLMIFSIENKDGSLVGLQDEDLDYLKKHIKTLVTQKAGAYKVLTCCEYRES